jgi:predicted NBD/HSP70 family sugar kinase
LRKGSGALSRDLNRASVLALIGSRGPIARIEIARELALSPATVTVLTRDLLQDGLVREVDQAPSNGGRPAILLGLVADAAQALGAKIAADRLTVVRASLDGEILASHDEPFDASAPDALPRLADRLATIIAQGGGARLLGVGLGVPGIVDSQRGIVEAPILGWRSVPLGPALQERLGVPILVDNDVNTLAVAERLYGRGRGLDHVLTVTIGRGVGLGIVVGGDLYRGARGGAGEFGHVTMVDDGPACECGKHGCLEALVADPALVSEAIDVGLIAADTDPGSAVAVLRGLADSGDLRASALYARAGRFLGRAVAGLVNVLSPQLVIVSGEGTLAWSHLREAFENQLREDTFAPLRDIAVEVDPWDDAKWARGAATLVLRATFAAPLYERSVEDGVRDRLAKPGLEPAAAIEHAAASVGLS